MSLYRQIINPRTGLFNLVPSNAVVSYKPGVATESALPTEGNEENDARLVNDTHHLYVWDGSSWIDQGDILDLTWAAISGKPSSSVANIDDAVAKKHTQNTDTILMVDGVNELFNGGLLKYDLKTDRWQNSDTCTFLGIDVVGAGNLNVAGLDNTAFGYQALYSATTGIQHLAIGSGALKDITTGEGGIGIGYQALTGITTGCYHYIGIGYQAGYQNPGDNFIAIGYKAGYQNEGNDFLAIGTESGYQNAGEDLVALGSYRVGYKNQGSIVTFLNFEAGYENTGDNVIGIGGWRPAYQNSGDNLIAIGYEAGYQNTVDNCVCIGYQAGKSNSTANQFILKQTNINATPLIQGDFSTGHLDFAGEISIKVYSQNDEPTLSANNRMAIWIDTNDSNRVYFLFRRGTSDQVAVELI